MPNDLTHNGDSEPRAVTATADRPPRLLVADDSATIRLALVRSMPEQAQIYEAVDGEQAWTLLQEKDEIELVITDLDMPKVNGYELLKRIRKSTISRIASIPVIVVTGAEDTKAIAQAFELGANDFIPKNADKVEIRARVRAHHNLALLIHELEESRRSLNAQANTDALTKLTNRRSFFLRAGEAIELMRRHRQPFSVLMIDVDHFKSINDTYGHQCGDAVLTQVADILGNNIRTNDILARIGGEEFAIAAPYSNRLAAVVLAERLRKAVESAEFMNGETRVPITISVGVASQDKNTPVTIDQLLARADARLYIAKRRGRNRLCATDGGEAVEDLPPEDNIGPRVEDALTMIQHGNSQAVVPHVGQLLEKVFPLYQLANEQRGASFDLDALRQQLEALGGAQTESGPQE
jgi:diguanylate cyclase (GGDEF)-like protein